MKKKQIQKLYKQFRPSYEQVRLQLFKTLEEKAVQTYNLSLRVYIDPKKTSEMTIELLQPTTKEQLLSVPMDENFVTVLKRIQKQEQGLLDRFSTNLVAEIANYWTSPEEETAEEVVTTTESEAIQTADVSSEEALSWTTFSTEIEKFPKFFTESTADEVFIKEKTAKEDRLLATISLTEENSFTIEKALERKYKLKTEVIPVIEAFAQTPIAKR
ncbi:MAG: hypothetical protein ACK5MW_00205 [Enterococcus sp.]